jgi:CHAT domain-containing protein
MAEARKNYTKSYSIKIRQFTGLPREMSKKFRLLDKQMKKIKKGEFRKAREYFNRSIAEYLKLYGENNPLFAEIYEQIGMLYALEKDYPNALDYLQKSLEIRLDTFGDSSMEAADSYLNIGICLRLKGDYTDAFSAVHTALTIKEGRTGKYHPDTADGYYQLGKIHFQLRQWNQSLLYLQESLMALSPEFSDRRYSANPSLDTVFSKPQLLEVFITKARALRMRYIRRPDRLEDLESSYNLYLKTAELLENMRRGYKSESYKLYFNEKNHVVFQEGIQTALLLHEMTRDAHYKVTAFLLSERSKAGVLAEALSESRAKQFAGIPGPLLEKEKDLKQQLTHYGTYLEKEYRKKDKAEALKIKTLEEKYYTLMNRYGVMIDEFEKNYHKYYDLKYRPPAVDFLTLQRTLSEKEVLLEYFIGDEILHIFVMTSQGLHVQSIPLEEDLTRMVQTYYRSIKKIEESSFRRMSSKLYHLLVEPIRHLLDNKAKVIVIPGGNLYYVPFESLAAETLDSPLTQLDYLIRRFAFSYHYSANLWLHSVRDSKWEREKAFIGFAPVFSNGKKEGYILTHDPPADTLRNQPPDQVDTNPVLSQLPATEEELRAIIHLFKNQRKKAAGYFHKEATENTFKSLDMTGFNLIHIATHGFEDTTTHKLSGLMFSPPAEAPAAGEDGILYSGEIYNLELKAELIVLSSCESGVGKLIKGEGMMALNRGFFYSGIRNIVFSLWKVEDRSTSQLMIAFYRNILDGQPYCRALRLAKLELLKNPFTAFPKYWSGFVLVGR